MYFRIQLFGGEEDLLEQLAVVEAVIRENSSVQRGIILSVVASLRTVDPYCGPVKGERGGGTVRGRERGCSAVVVPKLTSDMREKLPEKRRGRENA